MPKLFYMYQKIKQFIFYIFLLKFGFIIIYIKKVSFLIHRRNLVKKINGEKMETNEASKCATCSIFLINESSLREDLFNPGTYIKLIKKWTFIFSRFDHLARLFFKCVLINSLKDHLKVSNTKFRKFYITSESLIAKYE